MALAADAGSDRFAWSNDGESKALLHDGKRVAVVCDLDDTLIDGTVYTAGILGNNSEWSNPTFVRYLGGAAARRFPVRLRSLDRLGFPVNMPDSPRRCESAFLIVNDGVLNGSSKELVRDTIAAGGETPTGERASKSDSCPASAHLDAHDVVLPLEDDLNDFSDAFSPSENDAVGVADEAIRHSEY